MARVKKTKLRGKLRDLASRRIAEEVRAGKYPRAQAIAIGISRARAELEKTKRDDPKNILDPSEVDGIEYLVKTTFRYLQHPDVVAASPKAPARRRKLDSVWSQVWTHLLHHPYPSRRMAADLSFAAQEAADVLDDRAVQAIPFAVPSHNVARSLRDLVARMKDFRH